MWNKRSLVVHLFYNLLNHFTFHSEERLVNFARGRECFDGLSTLLVYGIESYPGTLSSPSRPRLRRFFRINFNWTVLATGTSLYKASFEQKTKQKKLPVQYLIVFFTSEMEKFNLYGFFFLSWSESIKESANAGIWTSEERKWRCCYKKLSG